MAEAIILHFGTRRHPGLGDAPACLNDGEAQAWRDIADRCPPTVLHRTDRAAVEVAARHLAAFRSGRLTSRAHRRELNAWLHALGVPQPVRASWGVSPAWRH